MSIFAFELSSEEILSNFNRFTEIVHTVFESRADNIMNMYSELGENIVIAPASSYEHFHNAIPGGYFDHILRVMNNATELYNVWKNAGTDVSNFTLEELTFAALHHDLGKLGYAGVDNRRYIENTSSWHYENMGRCYEINEAIPHMEVADLALFMLQKYHIPVSLNETLGIKLADGLYDPAAKSYYMGGKHNTKLRTHLPIILHHADMMATQYEYDRWAAHSKKGFKKIKG